MPNIIPASATPAEQRLDDDGLRAIRHRQHVRCDVLAHTSAGDDGFHATACDDIALLMARVDAYRRVNRLLMCHLHLGEQQSAGVLTECWERRVQFQFVGVETGESSASEQLHAAEDGISWDQWRRFRADREERLADQMLVSPRGARVELIELAAFALAQVEAIDRLLAARFAAVAIAAADVEVRDA